MAIIFDGPSTVPGEQVRAGQAVMLSGANANFGAVEWFGAPGEWGGFPRFKAIFTNISIRESTNHQFQQTLGNRIYLDAFGDRIGVMQLSGLAFFGTCNQDPRAGISHVMEFYRANKLTKRPGPLLVSVDPLTPYSTYLHTFQAEMFGEQHTAMRLYQFHFILSLLSP